MTGRRAVLRNGGRARSAGQALVEFSLVLPVLLLLFFGVIEGGYFAFTYVAVESATHEGARRAILATATVTEVSNKVISAARPLVIASGDVTIRVNAGGKTFGARTFGDRIEVRTAYTHRPLVALVFGSGVSFPMTGLAELMVE